MTPERPKLRLVVSRTVCPICKAYPTASPRDPIAVTLPASCGCGRRVRIGSGVRVTYTTANGCAEGVIIRVTRSSLVIRADDGLTTRRARGPVPLRLVDVGSGE